MSIYESVSPNEKFRLILAYPNGALQVLHDLARDEADEAARLGHSLDDMVDAALREVDANRAFLVVHHIRPWEIIALCGVTADGLTWFVPTQHTVETYRRDLADRQTVSWVVEFLRERTPKGLLINGVTPQNRRVIRWLKKVVGANVLPVSTDDGPAPIHPFVVPREALYVRP